MNHFIYAGLFVFSHLHLMVFKNNLINIFDLFGKLNCITFILWNLHTFLSLRAVIIFIPRVIFDSEHSINVRYLVYKLNTKLSWEDDILKELRTLYIRSYVLIRTFSKCSEQVKIEILKSYCTSLYCFHLWSTYRKNIFIPKLVLLITMFF